MTDRPDGWETVLAGERSVGRSIPRSEDVRLVQGLGRYLGDLRVDGALHVAFVRATYANARVLEVRTEQSRAAQGVVAVFTATDLGDRNGPVPVAWRSPGQTIPHYPALAAEHVAYVGQPVVAVVATSRELAEDAAELVEIEYEELPAVTNAFDALAPGSPRVQPGIESNLAFQMQIRSPGVDEAFATAPVIVEADLSIHRQTGVPMERRGFVAQPDPAGQRLTVWATVQHPHMVRDHLAELLSLAVEQVRVVAPDMGGTFGVYYDVYPEDLLVAWAAQRLGRPVSFIEDRAESFLSTVHARQQYHRAALALSEDGRILALRDLLVSDIGAFVGYSGIGPSSYTANYMTGGYRIDKVDIDLRCAFTNKVRSGGYRGFGQPQATFVLERLIDTAAARLDLDPAEIRRRNLLTAEEFPHRLPSGVTMDSADLPRLLDTVLTNADYRSMRTEQTVARAAGRLVGVGIALYTEATGTGSFKGLAARGDQVGGREGVLVRVGQDGSVVAYSGASHIEQGIRTALAQVCADELGLRPEDVTVVAGDTDLVPHSNRGSIGSRSALAAAVATRKAAAELATRIREVAADLLEAANPDDLLLRDGRVQVKGNPSHELTFAKLSVEAARRHRATLDTPPALEVQSFYEPSPTMTAFGSGVHLAMVEVDRETGAIEIKRYLVVHDCGTVINPQIVDGQIHGGAAQGFGGALLEELVYDDAGQLTTSTMMDYLIPTAMEIPTVEISHQEKPSPFQPLGAKGCGEAGTVGPAAALANAVSDALQAPMNHLPLRPDRVWAAAQSSVLVAAQGLAL
ncbi:xanthine dehydrogenase family protein molybdopterin-binding subunit [Micromonospora sp. NPDC048830]|uniref:xanthine dehydrogenase family protein molybdopterin-binding subunit n=1 Tax=Micromonospora sp. NPDC048830 TaxID=3364257 RepID=UPI00371F2AD0